MSLRLVYVACFVLLSGLLTGCFDVLEEVNMKTSGAGNIKATINLSKSKTKVASLMKLKNIDGIKVPTQGEIQSQVREIERILRATPGVSNVKSSLDFTNYIASISCDFKQVSALNAFTKVLSDHFKTKISSYSTYSYNPSTKVFARNYTYSTDAKKEFDRLKPENQKQFQQAFYTYIYRFEGDVVQQKSNHAKVATNKKAVMLKTNVVDLVNNKVNLSNQITTK